MSVRTAEAVWQGTLKEGKGDLSVGSGAYSGPYTWATRFGDEVGANPEELIGAAHAGCYSMFLSALLTGAGTPPTEIKTVAKVNLTKDETGPVIDKIELICNATVPGISDADFQEKAAAAKAKCPISRALAGPEISLTATLQ